MPNLRTAFKMQVVFHPFVDQAFSDCLYLVLFRSYQRLSRIVVEFCRETVQNRQFCGPSCVDEPKNVEHTFASMAYFPTVAKYG